VIVYAHQHSLPLNQRVQGSSPCAPTIEICCEFIEVGIAAETIGGHFATSFSFRFLDFVPASSFLIAFSPSAFVRLR
jgi:hypothetical protein